MITIKDSSFKDKAEYIKHLSNSKKLVSKTDLIYELCKDKDVLDIGCIDHNYKTALDLGDNWLHKQLKKASKSIIGLDILKEDSIFLNKMGYNIIQGNAEAFNLNRKFDVIVAGDLIEHLSNIGSFLQCVANHMHSDSVFIITSPNPFNIEQAILAIYKNDISVNDEHTCWLDPRVIYETISRTNLKITAFYWVDTRFKILLDRNILFKYILNFISEIIMNIRPICRRDYAILLKKK
ncbi:MAG: methyltransferase domain-containing protein [Pseudomonadota bacterium]